ncbi:unnamed protein product, partial [Musa textilis]
HNLVWPSLSCLWGPQLHQATHKNRRRLCRSEQAYDCNLIALIGFCVGLRGPQATTGLYKGAQPPVRRDWVGEGKPALGSTQEPEDVDDPRLHPFPWEPLEKKENFAWLRIPRSDQTAVNGGTHPSDNMMHVMDPGDLKPLRCALIRLEGCSVPGTCFELLKIFRLTHYGGWQTQRLKYNSKDIIL